MTLPEETPPEHARHERRVLQLALLAGLPGVAVSILLLWRGDYSQRVIWTVGGLLVLGWLATAVALRERVIRPLQTLSNILAALREGDYSIRARGADRTDPLGLALLESNLLGETLRTQRLGAMEATALLRTVMAEIDVAVFAFDDGNRVRLVNRAAERLLDQSAERLLGRNAAEIGLAVHLDGESPRNEDIAFPGGSGRWEVRRGVFRQDGRPHTLLVLTDVTKALREEELQAWQRLVRVLSHEINNSLAPIKSIAASLHALVGARPRPADFDEDLQRGLAVIGGRSEGLVRFMSAYARLARLPAPRRATVDIAAWVHRVAALETRVPVTVTGGPAVTLDADGDQLDQMLINLLRNAADATIEAARDGRAGGVRLHWHHEGGAAIVVVADDGPGLPPSRNLFVPFFTTKAQGSGIGLVLSRQIAEAHGGSLVLRNRAGSDGCEAIIRLPAVSVASSTVLGPYG